MGVSLGLFSVANDEIAEVMDRPSDFLPTAAAAADADIRPQDLSDGVAE